MNKKLDEAIKGIAKKYQIVITSQLANSDILNQMIDTGTNMNDDQLYEWGYLIGFAGEVAKDHLVDIPIFFQGFEDGKGDRETLALKENQSPYIAEEYMDIQNAPLGFTYTGEYRTPQEGEWYLTKNGNGKKANTPKNNRKRHILLPPKAGGR